MMFTEDNVLDLLSNTYDPELPVDIVNLGLIYSVKISESNIHIIMTLTSPGCPASTEIISNVSNILYANGANQVDVEITWQPIWTPNMMSEEAKSGMGF